MSGIRFHLFSFFRALLLCCGGMLAFAPTAVGQPTPVLTCSGTAPASWISSSAIVTQHTCKQSLLRSGFAMSDKSMDGMGVQPQADGLTAAWSHHVLLGIREWHPSGPPPTAADGLIDFSSGTLVEHGSVGGPGELWWGRFDGGSYRCCTVGNFAVQSINAGALVAVNRSESLLLAVGQETSVRHANSMTKPAQLMQFHAGKWGPWPDGSVSLHFEQHAATSVLSFGSSPIAPGSISGATLDLSIPKQLSGVLRFNLSIGGQSSLVSIPLKRDVDEATAKAAMFGVPGNPYRLRHGRVVGGAIVDCLLARDYCYLLDQEEVQRHTQAFEPRYQAKGMFFGAQGEYIAISFSVLLPDPKTPTTNWGLFRGLVILKRSSA